MSNNLTDVIPGMAPRDTTSVKLANRLVFIDSGDAVTADASNVNANYYVDIDVTGYEYVTLMQATIPKTYNMIASPYNVFEVSNDGATWFTVTVTPGNYNYINFQTELLTRLNALTFGTFAMQFSTTTRHFTFFNATAGLRFRFSSTSDMEKRCGFDNTTYLFSSGSLESVRVINLQLTSLVVITSNIIAAQPYNAIAQDIFYTILDSNVATSSVITYECPDVESRKMPIKNNNNIVRFVFYDDNHRQLQFNGGQNNLTLLLSN